MIHLRGHVHIGSSHVHIGLRFGQPLLATIQPSSASAAFCARAEAVLQEEGEHESEHETIRIGSSHGGFALDFSGITGGLRQLQQHSQHEQRSNTSASASSAATSSSSSASSSQTISLKDLESSMSEAYMGITDSGEGFYYASSANGELCIVMAVDTSGNTVSFVGPATTSGDMITVKDIANGSSLTFQVKPQSDGTVLLDMGTTGSAWWHPARFRSARHHAEAGYLRQSPRLSVTGKTPQKQSPATSSFSTMGSLLSRLTIQRVGRESVC